MDSGAEKNKEPLKVEIGANIVAKQEKWKPLLKFCRESDSKFQHPYLWGLLKKDFCNEKKWSRLTKSDKTKCMQLSRGWTYRPEGYKSYQFFELFQQIAIEFQAADGQESVDVNKKFTTIFQEEDEMENETEHKIHSD